MLLVRGTGRTYKDLLWGSPDELGEESHNMKPMKVAVLVTSMVITGPALGQGTERQTGTPPAATNQCWDTTRNELRDKTSPTTTMKTKETGIGQDRSQGRAAPPSGNAAGSATPSSSNAARPPGVTDC